MTTTEQLRVSEFRPVPAGRLAFFALQFLLILLVCFHDTFSIFSSSPTVLPTRLNKIWDEATDIVSAPLGQTLPVSNPLRQSLSAYLNATGIDAGYGYFAPNVPDNYKIVFELQYPDGHTQFELPQVNGRATGLRFSALLDTMAETEYEPLRSMMVKMLAYSVWQEHQEAGKVRAVLGYVDLPTPAEFRRGQRESYHSLFAYDFDFAGAQSERH